ncbi:MAG: hypothetical protein ACUVV4_06440 [Candidatus Bathyarchaeia archaeon]
MTSRVLDAEKLESNPAIIFEKVNRCSSPLLINLFGSLERIFLILNYERTKGSRLDFY